MEVNTAQVSKIENEQKLPANMPRVVIVGGGFGGLQTAKSLAKAPIRITLIDVNNYHLFQPMLYQVATAGLAAMGGQNRAKEQPWLPLALAIKVAFDTSQTIRLFFDQKKKYGAFCFWCLLAAATTLATIPQVILEAIAAIRQLFHRA